jgi:hypothetical protein
MPMTPYDAAQFLQKAYKVGAPPAPDQGSILELARLNHERQSELEDRARLGDAAAKAQLEGPGGVNEDIASDPYTGDAAQARTASNIASQHTAETAGFGSPQEQAASARAAETAKVTQPIQVEQAKTAGAMSLKDQELAGTKQLYEMTHPGAATPAPAAQSPSAVDRVAAATHPAGTPPPARSAAPASRTVAAAPAAAPAQQSRFPMAIDAQGRASFHEVMPPFDKPNTQERAVHALIGSATKLGDKVLTQYAQQHPDIETNPDKYTSVRGDAVKSYLGSTVMKIGNPGAFTDTQLNQDITAVKLALSRALLGGQARSSPTLIKMVEGVTPDVMYSPGENFKRIREAITQVLPTVEATHNAAAAAAGSSAPSAGAAAETP